MARFILFGTHNSADVVVNTDHVVAVEQIGDSTRDGEVDTCRLFLTASLWTDEDGNFGQDYIDVAGCLFDIHQVLNAD